MSSPFFRTAKTLSFLIFLFNRSSSRRCQFGRSFSFVQVLGYEVYKLDTALAATGVSCVSQRAHDAEVDGDCCSIDWPPIQSEANHPVEMDERVKQMFGIKE